MMIPYFNELSYKSPAYSYKGELIGRQKVNVQLFTDGEKTLIKEIRFIASLPQYAPSNARMFKGYAHYKTAQILSKERVLQMARFVVEMDELCKHCKKGFQVLQRPGKYGCTNCEH